MSEQQFNARVIEEFRANGGRVGGAFEDSPLVLLHHTGARSGQARVNPLGYITDGDRIVIVASNGGSPTSPSWLHNLRAHPEVTIEVGNKTIRAVASEATGEDRERLFRAMVAHAGHLVEYQATAGRLIPVILLTPLGGE